MRKRLSALDADPRQQADLRVRGVLLPLILQEGARAWRPRLAPKAATVCATSTSTDTNQSMSPAASAFA
ncbi:hypothetical protein [Streptomyces globisporus]|uniref:hypothetical protein n=1 Tax=Streptomyces globisporus TaxID=1908 RepID=UPI0033F14086